MNNDTKYVKLSELDGQQFTVEKAYKFCFKKWDGANRRMLVENNWQEFMRGDRDWRKIYAVDTNKGKMDLSQKQLKDMLEGVYIDGIADVNGKTFTVRKVVGQNDIPNYFINPVRQNDAVRTQSAPKPVVNEPDYDTGINIDDIPF